MDGHLSAWGEAAISSWQKEIPAESTRTGRKRQASATGVSPQLLWCLPAQHSWGQDRSHVLPNCTRTSVWVYTWKPMACAPRLASPCSPGHQRAQEMQTLDGSGRKGRTLPRHTSR